MNQLLSKCSLDAIEYKRDIAITQLINNGDDMEDKLDWIYIKIQCDRVLLEKTIDSLQRNLYAKQELDNYLNADMPAKERKAIMTDLCRCGWFEEYDPSAVCTRKQKLMTVDGNKYVIC